MRKVYIQAREDGELPGTGFYASWHGFTCLNYSIQKFTADRLPSLDLSAAAIVAGSVRTVRAALTLIGCPVPADLNIPPGTEAFLGRESWATTLGVIRRMARVPVFVKPFD